MEFVISDYLTKWEKYNPFDIYSIDLMKCDPDVDQELMEARVFGYNPTRFRIKDDWYDVIPLYRVARSPSPVDGGFHFVYLQINYKTNEYYIGVVNRKRWRETKRYQGSGVLFQRKFNGHKKDFYRYYIACCKTAKETLALEAAIVDEELLKDPKCLNLAKGGGGPIERHTSEERAAKQRQFMKEHPEHYQPMIKAHRILYLSENSPLRKKRNAKIKATMSETRYREMTRERILHWQQEHPEEYQQARENNRKAVKKPEIQEKRKLSLQKWKEDHPEEYKTMRDKIAIATSSPEARKKHSDSIKAWAEENPEVAKENVKKRVAASAAKSSKPVNMCDLETGEVIRTFKSQHEAAQWLVDNGLAKNTNCVSSINSVCQRKPCTTGYGYRKKAYGYDWQYAEHVSEASH